MAVQSARELQEGAGDPPGEQSEEGDTPGRLQGLQSKPLLDFRTDSEYLE